LKGSKYSTKNYGKVYIEYNAPGGGTEYKIYRKSELSDFEEIGNTTESNYTDTNEILMPGEKYSYKIVPDNLTVLDVEEIEVEIPLEFPNIEVLKKGIVLPWHAEVYISKPLELLDAGYVLKYNFVRTMATNGNIYTLHLDQTDDYAELNNAYKFISDGGLFSDTIKIRNIEVYNMRYEKYDSNANITYRTYLKYDRIYSW